jgi:hypothetical protein
MIKARIKDTIGLILITFMLVVSSRGFAAEPTQDDILIEEILTSFQQKYGTIYDQNSLIVTTTTLPSGEKHIEEYRYLIKNRENKFRADYYLKNLSVIINENIITYKLSEGNVVSEELPIKIDLNNGQLGNYDFSKIFNGNIDWAISNSTDKLYVINLIPEISTSTMNRLQICVDYDKTRINWSKIYDKDENIR